MSRSKPKQRPAAKPPGDRASLPDQVPERRLPPILALGIAGCALLLLGIAIGARFFPAGGADPVCSERFTYVNPLLACGPGPVISKRSYDTFRGTLETALRERARSGGMASASVYFRDLANGPTFGIAAEDQFVPASLLKLPLVLAFLSMEEDAPGTLARTIVYEADDVVPAENIRPAVTLRPGEAYSIETLLANTIRFSDNASYLLLRRYQRSMPDGDAQLLRTYRELGIVNPTDALDHTVTVRGYAALFRLLYNASYLSPELSELALSWLAASEFADGIEAGVPAGTVVAHKFGERSMTAAEAPTAPKQLHDCGIVYFPKNPYLLCVMTRGDDFGPLGETVRLVSRMVHDEVASRAVTPSR